MTTQPNQPYFLPLNTLSQSNTKNVLYYNANAPIENIYQCGSRRLQAANKLLENAYYIPTLSPLFLQAIIEASAILLNDAIILFEEANPAAIKLREENSNKKCAL